MKQLILYLYFSGDNCSAVTETIIYDPLISNRARNSSISTEIVGNIHKGPGAENGSKVLYALCTLDGMSNSFQHFSRLWDSQFDLIILQMDNKGL